MPNIATAEMMESDITEVHIPTLWSFHGPTLAVETSEEPWRPCRRFGNTQRSFGHIQLEPVQTYVNSQKVWKLEKNTQPQYDPTQDRVLGMQVEFEQLEAFYRLWLLMCWQVSTFNPSNQVEIPSRVCSNVAERV